MKVKLRTNAGIVSAIFILASAILIGCEERTLAAKLTGTWISYEIRGRESIPEDASVQLQFDKSGSVSLLGVWDSRNERNKGNIEGQYIVFENDQLVQISFDGEILLLTDTKHDKEVVAFKRVNL